MLICRNCGSDILEVDVMCPTCGWYAGPPNVRAAERDEERNALEGRYSGAIESAKINGTDEAINKFDVSMRDTCAVINVDIDFLYQFIKNDKEVYSSYQLKVEGQTRTAAEERNDRHRRAIEAMLFGKYAKEIRYAALSVDGTGLKAYGPYAMKLLEITISNRATLLEDNSYHFIPKHNIQPGDSIPPGCRATWAERHKLAVAKLARQISSSTSEADHSKILLRSKGDKAAEEYIEVHIYGGFNNKAIESVKGKSQAKKKHELAMLSMVKDYLSNAGQAWIEE